MKKVLSVALALTAGVSFQALAHNIKLVNQTGWDLHAVYMSPASEDNWGPDYLGDQILETGDSLTLQGVDSGTWDLLIVDMDGDQCKVMGVDISGSETVSISGEDLVGCQAAD